MSQRRTQCLELVSCDCLPELPEPGKFYYSEEFRTSLHLCACGCGNRVVLPIKPAGWTMRKGRNGISIFPSVGNREFDCRSHYFILDGRVDWLLALSAAAVEESRANDQRHMKQVYKTSAWDFVRKLLRRVIDLFKGRR